MSRNRQGNKPYEVNWFNWFMVILGFATIYYIYNPQPDVSWLRGLAYSTLVLLAPFILIRASKARMSRVTLGLFIGGGLLISYAMMQSDIQGWFHDTIPLSLTPLGLVSTGTGQIVIQNWWLILGLVALLAVGIYLTPKGEAEAF